MGRITETHGVGIVNMLTMNVCRETNILSCMDVGKSESEVNLA